MNSYAPKFRQILVRSPKLARRLNNAERFLRAALCAAITTIFWTIALLCFAAWCAYKGMRAVLWLLGLLWLIIIWPIEVVVIVTSKGMWLVWIVLIWIGGRVYRLVVATALLLRRSWVGLRVGLRFFGAWAVLEFGEPFVCTFCVYMGVMTTSFLPATLLLPLWSAALVGVTLSPLVAFAIAARVFDTRAYRRWRSSRARLGVRVLRAYSDGLIWALWLRRRERMAA